MPYVGEIGFPMTMSAASRLERNRLVKLTNRVAAYTGYGDTAQGVVTARGDENDYAVPVFPLTKIDRTFFVTLGSAVAVDRSVVPGADGKGYGVTYDVVNMDTADRPSPAGDAVYIVPAGGWSTGGATANQIAVYASSAWSYVTPVAGDAIYNADDSKFYIFNGTAWVATAAAGKACEAGAVGQDVALYNW